MEKLGNCPRCGRKNYRITAGVCHNCYRKFIWKRKKIICKRCSREKPIHAKGFCGGCYQFVFNLDRTKAYNYRKMHNIDYKTYKNLTQKCVICNFNKVVDLHHLDENRKNNSKENFIGLCPNHHRMLHDFKYKKSILQILVNKGYKIKKDLKLKFN